MILTPRNDMPRHSLCLFLLFALGTCAGAAAPPADVDRLRCPRPAEFAVVFSNGYAGDNLPRDEADFEKLLLTIREAGFNVVHCTFSEKRLALCKKHGVKMMIDLLASDHHVYKNPQQAQKLCESLRGDKAVWGYNVWNDRIAKTGPGRQRDVRNVRTWDPTHPAYCGTYRTEGLRHLNNGDVIAYYDFHWKRGIDAHFGHLLAFSNQAKSSDASFMSLLSASSGLAGKGNFNRNLYSASTLIACGGKGFTWFIGSELLDLKTMKWTTAGEDILKVQKRIIPIAGQLHPLGLPEAILTTPVTKTPNNAEVTERLPPGLDRNGIEKDYWLQRVEGEFLLGVFRDAQKRRVVHVVNHNAYAEMAAKLKATGVKTVSRFDRETGKWVAVKMNGGEVAVKLEPGDGELLRFEP